ncbi:glycosyltransferase family 4 protein [Rhodovulum steppense]|uniref:Glycosyltransferase involved in cell wall biosynthesis n=1 Tax=Rhodovulum steppense TaxID=540251 RepID=A0A4R1YMG1_9RHOB|nr:glycosyltransferase family 4 protein [Rhodovulum steppense]TCM78956.1 glycosyltransferase involved in cell wall biosynthesis [Rhodovulum steppense]
MPSPNVIVFYPASFWGRGSGETCYRICSHWPDQGLPVTVHTAACLRPDPAGIMAPALPAGLPGPMRRRLAARPRIAPFLERRSQAQALKCVRPGDICYFWPGAPIEAMAEARARGGRIVIEFINTHVAHAKRILDVECDRMGMPHYPYYTEATLRQEGDRVRQADAIFAPGPFVEPSIRESETAVPAILPASYGAFQPPDPPHRRPGGTAGRPLRFLYVGLIALRKGLHTLMEAWRRAALPAELWLAGPVERPFASDEMRARLLGDIPGTVRLMGLVKDIGRVYREADVFVFPSLEEGGPQVIYEAAGYGLPLVATPMGGGWIARDGSNALVVPPSDAEALAAALTRLHETEDLRLALGAQALADAPFYGWDQVADRRRTALLDFVGTGA